MDLLGPGRRGKVCLNGKKDRVEDSEQEGWLRAVHQRRGSGGALGGCRPGLDRSVPHSHCPSPYAVLVFLSLV